MSMFNCARVNSSRASDFSRCAREISPVSVSFWMRSFPASECACSHPLAQSDKRSVNGRGSDQSASNSHRPPTSVRPSPSEVTRPHHDGSAVHRAWLPPSRARRHWNLRATSDTYSQYATITAANLHRGVLEAAVGSTRSLSPLQHPCLREQLAAATPTAPHAADQSTLRPS